MNKSADHIMVDAHVHIHEQFDLNSFFLSSLQNFREALNRFHMDQPFVSFLLLTESSGVNFFSDMTRMADQQVPEHNFTIKTTGERSTLKVITNCSQELFVVAGRQIITSEHLEILALGLNEDYPDYRPTHTVLEDLANFRCLRVVPWGVGKWLGQRGNIIRSLITNWETGSLFLGDNGNRPSVWPLPKLFERARAEQIYNLPGSDPLPLAQAVNKAGSYGVMLPISINTEAPFQSLMTAIVSMPQAMIPFGATESLIPFIRNQIQIRLVNKSR
jgi:hypothetical protein